MSRAGEVFPGLVVSVLLAIAAFMIARDPFVKGTLHVSPLLLVILLGMALRKCVVVSEAPSFCSISSEVAARLQERLFYTLESPVLRVTGYNTPFPPSRVEEDFPPDLDRVLDAVDRSLEA